MGKVEVMDLENTVRFIEAKKAGKRPQITSIVGRLTLARLPATDGNRGSNWSWAEAAIRWRFCRMRCDAGIVERRAMEQLQFPARRRRCVLLMIRLVIHMGQLVILQ